MLEPKLAILDETDSGLDIDALRIVANGVNQLRTPENAAIVITHYQRLLIISSPTWSMSSTKDVLSNRRSRTGSRTRRKGYDWIKKEMGEE